MAAVVVLHVFYGWHVLRPVVVILFLEFCDFEVVLLLGDGGDDEIELSELLLSEVCEFVDALVVALVELLIAKDRVVRLIKDELAKGLFLGRILLSVVSYELFVVAISFAWKLAAGC